MTKEEIIDKLKDLGIKSTNAYPKKVYRKKDGILYIGLYREEMNEDFYFFDGDTSLLMKLPKPEDPEDYQRESFHGKSKYQVPLDNCTKIWEDKPYKEEEDSPMSMMTIRDYFAIKHLTPVSNKEWLNSLITMQHGNK